MVRKTRGNGHKTLRKTKNGTGGKPTECLEVRLSPSMLLIVKQDRNREGSNRFGHAILQKAIWGSPGHNPDWIIT